MGRQREYKKSEEQIVEEYYVHAATAYVEALSKTLHEHFEIYQSPSETLELRNSKNRTVFTAGDFETFCISIVCFIAGLNYKSHNP